MFFWDSTMIILIPAIILSIYAQYKVKNTYAKYTKINTGRNMTGAKVASEILTMNNVNNVKIEEITGTLSDHYDPRKRLLRLSSGNYRGTSIAAIGVAAHEVGHAVQHARNYAPIQIRNLVVPVANFSSGLAWPLLILGFIMSIEPLIDAGILLFTGVVLFHLVTLPVEFNASSRALAAVQRGGYLESREVEGARKVLNAAALTYVAAAAVSVLQLIRLLILRDSD